VTARRWGAVAEAGLAAVLWAALITGSAVIALTTPVFTSSMNAVLKIPQSAGLSTADAVRLAGDVRELVADREYDPLPSTWAGSPAFDQAAVSHLLDVRRVISAARLATGLSALFLAMYAVYCIAKKRFARLAVGMRSGAVLTAVLIVCALVAAFSDFTWFFTAFHGLFFAAGTWTFPADSLLIRLFPERFWMASGAAWAALMAVGAGLLAVVARFVRGAEARLSASRMANNV
jgi:integral membrane protein (TIGR01906 family)